MEWWNGGIMEWWNVGVVEWGGRGERGREEGTLAKSAKGRKEGGRGARQLGMGGGRFKALTPTGLTLGVRPGGLVEPIGIEPTTS